MKKPVFGRKRPYKKTSVDPEEIVRKKTYAKLKHLRKALKKAAQFEIQKVVRRIKKAKSDDRDDTDQIKKLQSQLVTLRAVDIDKLADVAAASVGITPSSPVDLNSIQPLEKKILGVKCVTEQLDALVNAIKTIETKTQKLRKGEPLKVPEAEREDSEDKEPDEDALQAIRKLMASKNKCGAGDAEEKDEESDDEDSGIICDEGLDNVEDDGFMQVDGHDISDYSGDSTIDVDNNEDQVRPDSSRKKEGGKPTQPRKDVAKKVPKKPKNRLGQRARRLLAEKSHGKKLDGKTTRIPFSSMNDTTKVTKQDKSRGESKKNNAKSAHQIGVKKDEILHPSWELKKRQQEAQKSMLLAAPKGKKIVFDDDE